MPHNFVECFSTLGKTQGGREVRTSLSMAAASGEECSGSQLQTSAGKQVPICGRHQMVAAPNPPHTGPASAN